MANRLFYISLLLFPLMCTACGGDDELQGSDKDRLIPISIGGGKEADMQDATRGRDLETVLSELHLDQNFRVWCYKTMGMDGTDYTEPQTVMDRYIVQWSENTAGSTASNSADWEYVGINNPELGGVQDIKYWDMNATSYRFFGFAPIGALAASTNYTYPANHGDGYTWFDITFPADATKPEDSPYISNLWFANSATEGKYKYRDCVTMEFMKPVCKVRIKMLRMDGTTITDPAVDYITSLKFQPSAGEARIVQAGNLKVSYAITGPSTVTNYTPSVTIEGSPKGTVSINKADEHYSEWYWVLPHVEQGDFQLVAEVGGKTKIATVPAKFMSWHPNMEYTYIFKLTDAVLEFIDIVQIAVTDWRTESSTHDIYNW